MPAKSHYKSLVDADPESLNNTSKDVKTDSLTESDVPTDIRHRARHNPTTNVEYLQKNGPTPRSDLPCVISLSDRRIGLSQFKVSKTTQSGGINKTTEPIAYLRDPETLAILTNPSVILRKWLDENEEKLQDVSLRTLRMKIDSQFLKNGNPVLNDFF